MRLSDTNARHGQLRDFLKPYPGHVSLFLLLNLICAGLEGLGVGLIAPLLNGLGGTGSLETGNRALDILARPFEGLPVEERLPWLLGVIFGLMLVKNAVGYARLLLNERLRIRMDRDLRRQLFDQLLGVEYRFILRQRSGDLLNHFEDSVPRTGMACRALLAQIPVLLVMGVYVSVLTLISWQLTVLAVALLGLLFLALGGLMSSARAMGESLTERNARKLSINVEALSGMRLIRLCGRERTEQDRFDRALDEANGVEYRLAQVTSLVRPLSEVAALAVVSSLLLAGGSLLLDSESTLLPLLLTFMFVLYRLMPLASEFNQNRVEVAKHSGAVDAAVQILSKKDNPYLIDGSRRTGSLREGIVLDSVGFAYGDEDRPALEDVSLIIPAGKTTALVGASGGGKSTLADLIPRFFDPDTGRLIADDVDLRDLDLASWRAHIGFVSQEPFLFHASVFDNIAYAKQGSTPADVAEVCDRAGVSEFLGRLPNGLDTVIGDRGIRLSGGQRQRLAIARAILRDPEILVMDEATSALDTVSERMVQNALDDLSRNRTALVIAHRLSTVVNAHRLVVLERGRVVEVGSHADLLARDGAYKRYHDLQDLENTTLVRSGEVA